MSRGHSHPASGGTEEVQHLLVGLGLSIDQAMLVFCGVVGLVAGSSAFAFYWMILAVGRLFESAQRHAGGLEIVVIALSPALGALACSALIHTVAPDARGGVTEVIDVILHRDGFIRARVAWVKAVASALCIGSGGSAGREGPVVQIGGSVGSALAEIFRVGPKRARLLVACGVAGGIAAVFNAPIAGATFAAEIITGRFEMGDLSYLFTASAMGAVVARALLHDRATFQIPAYRLASSWDLVVYGALGIACAVVGNLFIAALHGTERRFEGLRIPLLLKPVAGGLLVGIIGIGAPQALGTGSEVMAGIFSRPVGAVALLLWCGAKLIATSLTLGSGGSGGDLMPSLFLGAAIGGATGDLVNRLIPASSMPAGAYGLVGAAGLFSAVSHAPMTAIILGIEMGRDYGLVLPLLVTCSLAALVASRLRSASLYTLKLEERGIDVGRLRSGGVDPLDLARVEDVMTREAPSVLPDETLPELLARFTSTGHHGFLIVSGDGLLEGVVTLSDARQALKETLKAPDAGRRAIDVGTRDPIVCYPTDTLNEAVRRLGSLEVGRIPVVLPDDPRRVVGLLRRADLIRGYAQALELLHGNAEPLSSVASPRIPGGQTIEFTVTKEGPLAGCTVRDLGLPPGCVLVSVRRGRRTMAPSGKTGLKGGDRVTAFVVPEAVGAFAAWLAEASRA